MSLVEINRVGDGLVIRVTDTLAGRKVTVFLVDLYSRLSRPPEGCEEKMTTKGSNVELCRVRAGECLLTILMFEGKAEVIGGALLADGELTAPPEEVRGRCERALKTLEGLSPSQTS
ncbi:MAG: hypothetical protein ACP5FT_00290 [Acidilobus sp.]